MPRSVLRIGTRPSALALAQAEFVRQHVQEIITRRNFELVPMTDETFDATATVEEIRAAVSDSKIDLCVHAAKDLPAERPASIALGAVTARLDPREALLTRRGAGLAALKPGTVFGASSSRCAAQVLALGRGFVAKRIEGTLDARLRGLTAGETDALIVSVAALKRLGKDQRITEILPIEKFLPAAGQGSLAVECRAADKDMRAALARIEDAGSRRAFDAERAFLAALDAPYDAPVAALAKLDGLLVKLRALVAAADGSTILRDEQTGDDPEQLGAALAERMLEAGAGALLAAVPVSR